MGLCKSAIDAASIKFVAYLNHLVSLGQVVRLKFPVLFELITLHIPKDR